MTLEEVLAVVTARRVPLAAELAGYLALEMAEGASSGPGELEASHVYVSDEGTVALVRLKKDGDAEPTIRAFLGLLLEAGGTQTPALGLAARKASGSGTAALARELEAALIPVNRAAGRRALARLAREVKRVTQGVGRNASIPPPERGRTESRRPSTPSFSENEQPTAAKRPEPAVMREASPSKPASEQKAEAQSEKKAALQRPISDHLPTVELSNADAARLRALPGTTRESAAPLAPPPQDELDEAVTKPRGVPVAPAVSPPPVAGPPATAPAPAPTASKAAEDDDLEPVEEAPRDGVDELLSSFGVSDEKGDGAVGRDLKAIVGVDPTPPPLTGTSPTEAEGESVEELLALSKEDAKAAMPAPAAALPATKATATAAPRDPPKPAAPPRAKPKASEPARPQAAPKAPSFADERALPTAPSIRHGEVRRRRGLLDVILGLVLAVLLGAGGYLLLMRATAPPVAKGPTQPSAAPVPSSPPRACKASLQVEGAPDKSEILLRIGQAPVEVDHMPVGTRLEFVATAESHAPKRAVIPAGGAWEKSGDGRPRYELAIQLDPSKARGAVDPWPPAEPGSSAGGEGAPGVVRVVASPKGAEVWLLVGLGPEALIERLPCAGDTHVLVAGTPSLRKRLVVRESDFVVSPSGPNAKTAKVSAK
ncbi:MAG: hypothetical protein IPG50_29015 [Myxococcales bacterium]|nr:hypothetical protein [Myxococcales bacterium]